MLLKMKCQSKQNGTKKRMTLKKEFHLKINVTQNGMSFKIECHSKQNGKNWNVTQIGMFLKLQ